MQLRCRIFHGELDVCAQARTPKRIGGPLWPSCGFPVWAGGDLVSRLIAGAAKWAVFAAVQVASGQEPSPNALENALAALRGGDAAEAERLASNHLDSQDGSDPSALWVRANARDVLGNHTGAVSDYEMLSRARPGEPRILMALGAALFKAGQVDRSIDAFDSAASSDSTLGPHLWQRGISHYYARRYDDCIAQFEVHRTVNPQDVENSVWHFLCVAARDGFDAARAGLIPVERDARVPMMEVFRLFGGSASPADVLEAAQRSGSAGRGSSPEFYAHLYLGLYYEAKGEPAQSADQISEAVRIRLPANYMWQVARVHQQIRARGDR